MSDDAVSLLLERYRDAAADTEAGATATVRTLTRDIEVALEAQGDSEELRALAGHAQLLLALRALEDGDHESELVAAQQAEAAFEKANEEGWRRYAKRRQVAALIRLRRIDDALAVLDTAPDVPSEIVIEIAERITERDLGVSLDPVETALVSAAEGLVAAKRDRESRWFWMSAPDAVGALGAIAEHTGNRACAERFEAGLRALRKAEDGIFGLRDLVTKWKDRSAPTARAAAELIEQIRYLDAVDNSIFLAAFFFFCKPEPARAARLLARFGPAKVKRGWLDVAALFVGGNAFDEARDAIERAKTEGLPEGPPGLVQLALVDAALLAKTDENAEKEGPAAVITGALVDAALRAREDAAGAASQLFELFTTLAEGDNETVSETILGCLLSSTVVHITTRLDDRRAIDVQRTIYERKLARVGESQSTWFARANLGSLQAHFGDRETGRELVTDALTRMREGGVDEAWIKHAEATLARITD